MYHEIRIYVRILQIGKSNSKADHKGVSSLELVQAYISLYKNNKNEMEKIDQAPEENKPVIDLGILIEYLKEDIDEMLRR
jgi:hypothetical protein